MNTIDLNDPATVATYKNALLQGKILGHASIDRLMTNDTADPSDDFIAILGTVPNGARAGYPQITIPMGYNATQRRAVNVSVHGNAYTERNLLGVAYVIEQGTKKRKPVSQVNPSMYRCAKTVPAPPFAERGSCNPGYAKLMDMVGKAPTLGFSLETESAKSLQERMTAGTLSAETLTRAYLARIALTNAEGPATQAVRSVNGDAISDAKALDRERARKGSRGPLHGIPVLVDDSIGVKGMPTTGGSIALQESKPDDDSAIVARLIAAGAVILGKTNISELNGVFDANLPDGYSSLGGQVLLPSDTDKTPGRLVRRLGGGDGLRPGGDDRRAGDVARHGAADRAGGRRRRRRPQADGRTCQPRRRAAGRDVTGLAGPDQPDGLRRGRAAAGDRRRGRGRSRDRRRAGPAELPGRPRADGAERQARGGDQQHRGALPDRGRGAAGARRHHRRHDGRQSEPEPAEHRPAGVQA